MNKTALITGAAKRIGKSMSTHLANRGWNIAIHYNTSKAEAEGFCNELRMTYPDQRFEIFKADLNNPEEVEMLLPHVIKKFPEINLLINNASVFEPATISQSSTQFLEQQLNVNFKAPFILCRNFAHLLHSGIIVNFVDTRNVKNQSDFAAYSL